MSSITSAITTLATLRGFDLSKLVKKALARRPKERKIPVKYRDPLNPTNQWSGRGKQPTWFRDALSSGKRPDELLIPEA